jgi:ribosome maturation factor RimP
LKGAGKDVADTIQQREQTLQKEITQSVERGLPGVEVIAVELTGKERFTVFVDHPDGVDHALCARVTDVLREYLRQYSIDVSSPGIERPLRKPAHFANVLGRRIAVRTAAEIDGRKRFRGELVAADDRTLTLRVDRNQVAIPYEAIVRGNLIDTSEGR